MLKLVCQLQSPLSIPKRRHLQLANCPRHLLFSSFCPIETRTHSPPITFPLKNSRNSPTTSYSSSSHILLLLLHSFAFSSPSNFITIHPESYIFSFSHPSISSFPSLPTPLSSVYHHSFKIPLLPTRRHHSTLAPRHRRPRSRPMPAPSPVSTDLSDDWRWGPPGELPPRLPFPPHHPPLLRRAAAAAAAVTAAHENASHSRRPRLLTRQRPRSHVQYPDHWLPRYTWELSTPRGMPVLFEERVDWETPYNPFAHGASSARRRIPGRRRRVGRLTEFLAWRIARRRARSDPDEDDSLGLTYEELLELDDGNVRCGLSKDELAALTTVEATKEHMATDCHICLDAFDFGVDVVVLSCEHFFHVKCIHTWLKQKRSCPICRCDL